jgi:hypothetical protein
MNEGRATTASAITQTTNAATTTMMLTLARFIHHSLGKAIETSGRHAEPAHHRR